MARGIRFIPRTLHRVSGGVLNEHQISTVVLLPPVGTSSLLVGYDYGGAVGIHYEDLVVSIPVTLEGNAFAVR
jgi:hypothetical protein